MTQVSLGIQPPRPESQRSIETWRWLVATRLKLAQTYQKRTTDSSTQVVGAFFMDSDSTFSAEMLVVGLVRESSDSNYPVGSATYYLWNTAFVRQGGVIFSPGNSHFPSAEFNQYLDYFSPIYKEDASSLLSGAGARISPDGAGSNRIIISVFGFDNVVIDWVFTVSINVV